MTEELPDEVQKMVDDLKAEFGDDIGIEVITLPKGILGGDSEEERDAREIMFNMGAYHAQRMIGDDQTDEARLARYWVSEVARMLLELQQVTAHLRLLLAVNGIDPTTGQQIGDETIN